MGWQSLRRNWHVAIVGLLFTIGLVGAAYILVPAKYVSSSQIVLLPPPQANPGTDGILNPYMNLVGLQSMASVIANAMTDDQAAETLKAAGVSQYTVQYDSLSPAPILIVQATEPTPEEASAALALLDREVPLTVVRLQKEALIPHNSFVSAQIIARPSTPTKSEKTPIRAMALAFVVGIVLTLLSVSLIDGWRIRRRTEDSSPRPHRVAGTAGSFARPNSIGEADLPLEQTEAPYGFGGPTA
jgi:hypothetical protein